MEICPIIDSFDEKIGHCCPICREGGVMDANTKKATIEDFYKEAFCVDGEVKILSDAKGFKITGIVELNDSKRGRFYIARVWK